MIAVHILVALVLYVAGAFLTICTVISAERRNERTTMFFFVLWLLVGIAIGLNTGPC